MREELKKSLLDQLELLNQASKDANVNELCMLTSGIVRVVEAIESGKCMNLENETIKELQGISITIRPRYNNDFKFDSDFFEYLSKCMIEYQAHMRRSSNKWD